MGCAMRKVLVTCDLLQPIVYGHFPKRWRLNIISHLWKYEAYGSIYLAEFEGSHATSLPTQQYELDGLHNSPKLMLCELQMVFQLYFALNSSHFRVICQNYVPLDAPTFYSWYCLKSSLYLLMFLVFFRHSYKHTPAIFHIFSDITSKKFTKSVTKLQKTLHAG